MVGNWVRWSKTVAFPRRSALHIRKGGFFFEGAPLVPPYVSKMCREENWAFHFFFCLRLASKKVFLFGA